VLLGWGSLALRKAGRRHQAAEASGGIIGAGFRIPQRLTDLEHRLVTAGQPEKGLDRYLRQLSRVMGSTDDRATELRHAAALLLRASVSRDLELSLTYCFMCLEALLLEPNTTEYVLGRLVETVAYSIGTSAADRTQLRRDLKELYTLRSRYVHTGQVAGSVWTRPREQCLEIVSRVLQREIADPVL
jgi:Apea-like HEPN